MFCGLFFKLRYNGDLPFDLALLMSFELLVLFFNLLPLSQHALHAVLIVLLRLLRLLRHGRGLDYLGRRRLLLPLHLEAL